MASGSGGRMHHPWRQRETGSLNLLSTNILAFLVVLLGGYVSVLSDV